MHGALKLEMPVFAFDNKSVTPLYTITLKLVIVRTAIRICEQPLPYAKFFKTACNLLILYAMMIYNILIYYQYQSKILRGKCVYKDMVTLTCKKLN